MLAAHPTASSWSCFLRRRRFLSIRASVGAEIPAETGEHAMFATADNWNREGVLPDGPHGDDSRGGSWAYAIRGGHGCLRSARKTNQDSRALALSRWR